MEYDEKLVDICYENMRKLGMENAVDVICCDATAFSAYGEYDVFYFFNPFPETIMGIVINRTLEQCRGKEITIIYFRPRYPQTIEDCGLLHLEKHFFDKETGYSANVYRGRIPGNAIWENMPPL